jgi:hypothetical protein
LRFNFQPCNLSHPFREVVVGFTIHHDMNYVITERKGVESQEYLFANGSSHVDAGALAGSYES